MYTYLEKNKTFFFPFFRDGQSRCGVYCAANACIEQVIQHGEVDVFQAVKTVRRHRPQLVENIVCYSHCGRIFIMKSLLNFHPHVISRGFFGWKLLVLNSKVLFKKNSSIRTTGNHFWMWLHEGFFTNVLFIL